MATEARRLERNVDGMTALLRPRGSRCGGSSTSPGTSATSRFLEGTGSLILDRPRRQAYASLSPRTDPRRHRRLRRATRLFDPGVRRGATAPAGRSTTPTCCSASAPTSPCSAPKRSRRSDRAALIAEIEASGRTLIEVDYDQMGRFACNLIELRNRDRDPVIALSSAALGAFRPDQLRVLEGFGELVEVADPDDRGGRRRQRPLHDRRHPPAAVASRAP